MYKPEHKEKLEVGCDLTVRVTEVVLVFNISTRWRNKIKSTNIDKSCTCR